MGRGAGWALTSGVDAPAQVLVGMSRKEETRTRSGSSVIEEEWQECGCVCHSHSHLVVSHTITEGAAGHLTPSLVPG